MKSGPQNSAAAAPAAAKLSDKRLHDIYKYTTNLLPTLIVTPIYIIKVSNTIHRHVTEIREQIYLYNVTQVCFFQFRCFIFFCWYSPNDMTIMLYDLACVVMGWN